LLDGELGDVQEALDVRRDERLEVPGCVVRERLAKKMPALLTSASIDLKRDSAVSTIL
jgi:hypothetical protein